MILRIPARALGIVAAMALTAGVSSAPASAAPATRGATTVRTAVGTADEAQATLSAQTWKTPGGKRAVTIRTNSSSVTLTYKNKKGKKRSTTVEVSQGQRTVLLPAGSRSIKAQAKATSGLRASAVVTASAVDTTFTLAVIPDTQPEVTHDSAPFYKRMNWLVSTAKAQDLEFVIHVGDLVDTDSCGTGDVVRTATGWQCSASMKAARVFYPIPGRATHYQWEAGSAAFAILDRGGIDYSVAVGNHDSAAVCGGPACVGQSTLGVPLGLTTNQLQRLTTSRNVYFPTSRFHSEGRMGFFEAGRSDNMYQTFQAGGLDWMVLTLELWPRQSVLDWAKKLVAGNPNRNVIINTHHFVDPGGAIPSSKGGYGDTSPQQMLTQLAGAYPNVVLVTSGHKNGTTVKTVRGKAGTKVAAILTAFHDSKHAQTRLIQVNTSTGTITTSVRVDPGGTRTIAKKTVSGLTMTLPR